MMIIIIMITITITGVCNLIITITITITLTGPHEGIERSRDPSLSPSGSHVICRTIWTDDQGWKLFDHNCIDTVADHHLHHHLCRHEPGDSSSYRENPSSRHRDRGRSLSAAVPCKTRPEIIRNQLRTVELTNNPYIGLDTALQPPWDWLRSIFLYNERSL